MKLAQSHTHNFLLHYGGGAALVVFGVAIVGAFLSEPTPPPLPAAHPAPARVVAPVHPAATIAHATTVPAPAVALGPFMLPAQPAPTGLRQGYATRAVASSPLPATYGDQPQFTALATTTEPTPTGSWSTAIPAALRAIAPSAGLVQTTITAYAHVATAGPHVLILSVSGGPAKAALTVDGQAAPLTLITRACNAFSGCPQADTTGAGSVNLAAGLHIVTVIATTTVGDPPATFDVYARGPATAMPEAIVPWAVPRPSFGGAPSTPKVLP